MPAPKTMFHSYISQKLLLLFMAFYCIPVLISAQGKEGNMWFFGQHAGVDFNPGSPPVFHAEGQTNLTGGGMGSACISDAEGNLLFYSDSRRIWNRNHTIMQNGADMGQYCNQGGVIPMSLS